MANYLDAVLVNGQVQAAQDVAKFELRAKKPTLMELALKNQSISIPSVQSLMVSELRVVDVHYFTKTAVGSATAKTHNWTGTNGDSKKYNVVYVTKVETFSINAKIGQNSVFDYTTLFANKYKQACRNLRTRHDDSVLAYLLANRCQLSAATLTDPINASGAGTWDDTNKALLIAGANEDLFIQQSELFMQARDYEADFDTVLDLRLYGKAMSLANQGSSNDFNSAFQFGNSNIVSTSSIIDATFAGNGVGMIMPKGALAGIVFNDPANRAGTNKEGVALLTTGTDVYGSGATFDIAVRSLLADTSGQGGSTQDIMDYWEVTAEIGYVLPPLSLTNDSVVHEFTLVP